MNTGNSKLTEKRHPIQVVSKRSGLSPDVLRAWEKRYGIVSPARSAGGRRLYSDSDIERLRLILEAMAGGRRIGQLAKLSAAELVDLVREDRDEAASRNDAGRDPSANASPDSYLAECLDAVRALDSDWLRAAFGRAVVALRPATFLDEVATPLMHRIGSLWGRGELSPGHEHLATAVIRHTLGEVTAALQPANGAPRIVVATPARQRHEIGAMIVTAAAAAEGWRATYLGADLPAEDIAAAASQLEARAVALSITHPADDQLLSGELMKLRDAVPSEVPILIGGRGAPAYKRAIDAAGAVLVAELNALREELRRLALARPEMV